MDLTGYTLADSTNDHYDVWADTNGIERYVSKDGSTELAEGVSELDLYALWTDNRFYTPHSWLRIDRFRDLIRTLIIDPEEADDIELCDACEQPTTDERSTTQTGEVCENCFDGYQECAGCNEYASETTSVSYYDSVCASCLENYTFCEDCDEYYHHDYASDHAHDDDCDCESPVTAFTIRNDGEAPLANDTRVTIGLPAGVISDEGIGEIASLMRTHGYETPERAAWRTASYSLVDSIGATWQTKHGNFTKRLSRHLYKSAGLKLPAEVLSRIGNIARDHSSDVSVTLETTRDLNLPAEDFYHADSCWWQSYSHSRCCLKSNGGFAIRTFTGSDSYSDVAGRAWVMPLKRTESGKLTETFETQNPTAFVVFNGYGDLEGYAAARILAHMAGMTYRKVSFSCGSMYINSGGYLVAPEEIVSEFKGGIALNPDDHSSLHYTESQELVNV